MALDQGNSEIKKSQHVLKSGWLFHQESDRLMEDYWISVTKKHPPVPGCNLTLILKKICDRYGHGFQSKHIISKKYEDH